MREGLDLFLRDHEEMELIQNLDAPAALLDTPDQYKSLRPDVDGPHSIKMPTEWPQY
ncbi:MAG TPA: hypothetical protein V6C97_15860 [Oculatellaceae cyanobacterium]